MKDSNSFIYRLLMWMGFNSLVLFPVHFMIRTYLGVFYSRLGIGSWYWIVVLPSMVVASVPLCNLITNYTPWILGKFSKSHT